MSLFGAIVSTVVNVVTLPVAAVKDAVMWPADTTDGEDVGHRTKAAIEKIKKEADAR